MRIRHVVVGPSSLPVQVLGVTVRGDHIRSAGIARCIRVPIGDRCVLSRLVPSIGMSRPGRIELGRIELGRIELGQESIVSPSAVASSPIATVAVAPIVSSIAVAVAPIAVATTVTVVIAISAESEVKGVGSVGGLLEEQAVDQAANSFLRGHWFIPFRRCSRSILAALLSSPTLAHISRFGARP
jgi:hypothetical protein